jgi:proteic killer suppression protein
MNKIKNDSTTSISKGIFEKGISNDILKNAKIKIFRVISARDLRDLKSPLSNHLEKLKDDRDRQYSIRVNDRYRICFDWINNEAFNIEFIDYHK